MPSADELIIARAQEDFEAGLAHAREQIRLDHGRFVAASLDAVMMGALSALRVREQMRDDVAFLIGLAHRVAKGEDPAALAQQNLARVLRLKGEMKYLAREGDPAFEPVLSICRANMAKRLPDLARMVVVGAPADYSALVRAAFPDRAEVDRIVDENRAFTLEILDHLERHPHVLRLPHALLPKISAMSRDMIEWQTARVREGVDDIYRGPPSAASE